MFNIFYHINVENAKWRLQNISRRKPLLHALRMAVLRSQNVMLPRLFDAKNKRWHPLDHADGVGDATLKSLRFTQINLAHLLLDSSPRSLA